MLSLMQQVSLSRIRIMPKRVWFRLTGHMLKLEIMFVQTLSSLWMD